MAAEARGRGIATEAASALLTVADRLDDGELLCLIDPQNRPSRNVADKLGFRLSHRTDWMGDPDQPVDVLIRSLGEGGQPLRVPELEYRHDAAG